VRLVLDLQPIAPFSDSASVQHVQARSNQRRFAVVQGPQTKRLAAVRGCGSHSQCAQRLLGSSESVRVPPRSRSPAAMDRVHQVLRRDDLYRHRSVEFRVRPRFPWRVYRIGAVGGLLEYGTRCSAPGARLTDLPSAPAKRLLRAPVLDEMRDLRDDLLTRAANFLELVKGASGTHIILGAYQSASSWKAVSRFQGCARY
jgi:hypothetical protein